MISSPDLPTHKAQRIRHHYFSLAQKVPQRLLSIFTKAGKSAGVEVELREAFQRANLLDGERIERADARKVEALQPCRPGLPGETWALVISLRIPGCGWRALESREPNRPEQDRDRSCARCDPASRFSARWNE